MRLLMLFLLAGSLPAEETTRNAHTTAKDIAAGAKTFRSHCAPCHGYRGEGGRGPNLAANHFYHGSSDADLFHNISEGISGTEMPGIFYSADRVWQIVAFIRSLNAGREKLPGDSQNGAKLFESSGCAQCHLVRGHGGELGPDLSDIGASRSPENLRQSLLDPNAEVPPRYWTVSFVDVLGKAIKGFRLNEDSYTVQLLDMRGQLCSYNKDGLREFKISKRSIMPSYGDSLTAKQVNDVVAYLSSLRPK
jgi:putative heme-binding domain-containing protein